ncbi:prepilin peptidase, partial [Mycobacterium kansasii]
GCGAQLSVMELVPVLGWLAVGGRCRRCGSPVPAASPVGEAAAGGVLVVLFLFGGWLALAAGLLLMACLLGGSLVFLALAG